jgi:transposase
MQPARKPYPSDISDGEWAPIAPYLVLLREDAGQRLYSLRELFNGLRYVIRHGIPWRAMPNDLPPWAAVYQQAQRWLIAGVFEALASDLRAILRLAAGHKAAPSAAILDSRTLRSTPESGERAGYDGAKRKGGLQAAPGRRHPRASAGSARHPSQRRGSQPSQAPRAGGDRPVRRPGLCRSRLYRRACR